MKTKKVNNFKVVTAMATTII